MDVQKEVSTVTQGEIQQPTQANLTNPEHVASLINQLEAQGVSIQAQLNLLRQLQEDLANDSTQRPSK